MHTIPFNFYALLTILMIILMIALNFDFGPMKKAEIAQNPPLKVLDETETAEKKTKGKVIDLILPIAVLIVTCIAAMLYTGGIFDKTKSYTAEAGTSYTISDDAPISVYVSIPEQGENTSESTYADIKGLFANGLTAKGAMDLGTLSSDMLEDGKITGEDGATVTLPADFEIADTDAYIDAMIAYYETQGYTDLTKEKLGVVDGTVISVKLTADAEATIAKGTAVTVGKADISTWELLTSSFAATATLPFRSFSVLS